MKKVGVVGMTGQMGTGIGQVCAQSGYQVIGSSRSDDRVKEALASINSRLARNVEKGTLSQQDKDATMARIKGTTDMKDFADCDLIIETAAENMNIKKGVFAELTKICPKNTILATNTSSLSIIDIATATNKPDKVLGLHFFNPVPVMKLLEIVKTVATSDDTLAVGKDFGKSLGKTVVIAQDAPGFIVNRLIVPFILNAIRMVADGIATREDVDTGINLGLNHPMGPLALADLIGLDTVLSMASSIYDETKDPQYISPILLRRMVTAGWLGRKTKKGFYDYK
ncbi:MAG: 3-hydroxybutyryl-CoA dehydrogenase [Chloroflexota bacterium]